VIFSLLLASLASAALPAKQYELCGISADSVADLKRQVRTSRDYEDMPGSGNWHARINKKTNTSWLFPDSLQKDAEIAICRAFTQTDGSVYANTQLICDGSDVACDAERDRLLGPQAAGGRLPQ
jgi:hypothetical protein